MAATIKNAYGDIIITNDVIAKIAGYAANRCYGVVGMAFRNKRDGFASLLKKESLSKGVNITIDGTDIYIDLHIISEYGVNISTISKNIVDEVKYFVEEATGFTVKKVNVIVESIRVD